MKGEDDERYEDVEEEEREDDDEQSEKESHFQLVVQDGSLVDVCTVYRVEHHTDKVGVGGWWKRKKRKLKYKRIIVV